MKKVLLLVVLLGIAGCEPYTSEETKRYDIPAGLKDCLFFRLSDDNGNVIRVVRCPNSSTTTTMAQKNPTTTTVVDG